MSFLIDYLLPRNRQVWTLFLHSSVIWNVNVRRTCFWNTLVYWNECLFDLHLHTYVCKPVPSSAAVSRRQAGVYRSFNIWIQIQQYFSLIDDIIECAVVKRCPMHDIELPRRPCISTANTLEQRTPIIDSRKVSDNFDSTVSSNARNAHSCLINCCHSKIAILELKNKWNRGLELLMSFNKLEYSRLLMHILI